MGSSPLTGIIFYNLYYYSIILRLWILDLKIKEYLILMGSHLIGRISDFDSEYESSNLSYPELY